MSLRLRPGRRTLVVSSLGVAAAAAVLGYVLFTGDDTPRTSATKANDVSGRATACLAADSASSTGGDTVTGIWSAMQTAGTQHGTNVQQMIEPATTAEQAAPHLAGLLVQHCDLIVTVGAPFGRATTGIASAAPSVPIIAVDSTLSTSPTNVTLLAGPGAAARVSERVGALRRHAAGS
ncbi:MULTISPECIES: type 1 periplasmic-binding domain-containing protein [Kitasatospora]|uniref:BMP family ABC transporter substrate-binding protein n=1 Tax=Kitasatospora cathayae TaxID=3004092 RepID=A0ABY7QEG4_9ACTN|nr:hypothetical protein [Kitasatospora sp. HUAS 3-15]WBP91108.1 hypothetical protein O1G21_38030 [Kitasatospora sp. HUAS 3-15]